MEVITTHINADFDALGSMIAAKKLYPDAVLAFPGGQEKTIRDFLLSSAMYLLDVQKASRISLDRVSRLILVDIRQAGRLGKFSPLCSRKGVEIHIYDHHPPAPDDVRGAYEVIQPCGSTTTIMCGILQERGIDITPDEATVMMLGIYEDTGSLSFSSTTVRDVLAVAFLLENGADLDTVASHVRYSLTEEQREVLNQFVLSVRHQEFSGVRVAVAGADVDEYVGEVAVLTHKLAVIEAVDAIFTVTRSKDSIYVVGRSRTDSLDVAEVLGYLGGGLLL